MVGIIDTVKTFVNPFRTSIESTRQKMGLGFVEAFKSTTGLTLHPLDRISAMKAQTSAGAAGALTGGTLAVGDLIKRARERVQARVVGTQLGGVLQARIPPITVRSRTGEEKQTPGPFATGFRTIGYTR